MKTPSAQSLVDAAEDAIELIGAFVGQASERNKAKFAVANLAITYANLYNEINEALRYCGGRHPDKVIPRIMDPRHPSGSFRERPEPMTKPPDAIINDVLKKIRNLTCPDDERVALWEAAGAWLELYIELYGAAGDHVDAVNSVTSGPKLDDPAAAASFDRLCWAVGSCRPLAAGEDCDLGIAEPIKTQTS